MPYIVFFAVMYFIQGAALAYIINFQKPYLASEGIAKGTLGLFTSLLLLPFILKVFLGMLSDKVPLGQLGTRKPYMTIGLAGFGICYFLLSAVHPGQDFTRFAVLTWLASLSLALFDTCADGWAVDVAEESEQSAVQASMIAGKSLGLILMSFAFGRMAAQGFSSVFQTLAVMSAAVLLLVWLTPYRPRPAREVHAVVGGFRDLLQGFYILFAILGVVYSIASFGTDGLVTLHLSEQLGAGPDSNAVIGVYGVARGVGALLGAGLHVLVSRRFGLRRAQYLALIALGAGCLLPLAGLPVVLAGALWGLAWGFQETAFVTLSMRFAEGAWAATFFAIAMIFSNVGTSIGEALAAPLVPKIGYGGVFVGFAVLSWAAMIFVRPVLKHAGD